MPLSFLLVVTACDSESGSERRPGRTAREDPTAQFEPRPRLTPTPSPTPTERAPLAPFSSQPTPSPTEAPPAEPALEAGDEPTTFLLILDDRPAPGPAPEENPAPLDNVTLQDLVNEREKLRQELRKLDQQASDMAQLPLPPPPPTAETPRPGARFAGTIRDLNLTGVPDADAQAVMRRYGMKTVLSTAPAGVTQSYLSGATGQDGQRFSARSLGRNEPTHALVITPTTIEQMARLERQELQKRGLDPSRTLVQRIVFGVVGSGNTADLGVVLFEAVPVTQPVR